MASDRYDLDACDIQEKYPEGFTVTLHVEVHDDSGGRASNDVWEGFSTKSLNPNILFSSNEEKQEVLQKFGECSSDRENIRRASVKLSYLHLVGVSLYSDALKVFGQKLL